MSRAEGGGPPAKRQQYSFKVLVLGDRLVGKTCFAYCLAEGGRKPNRPQNATLGLGGVEWLKKHVDLPGNLQVTLEIWDVSGAAGPASGTTRRYTYGCQAVLLVYDVTKAQGLEGLEVWLEALRTAFADNAMPYIALVANKSDQDAHRCVTVEQHSDFVARHNLYSYTVSALTGAGVEATAFRVAADLTGVPLTQRDLDAALCGVISLPPSLTPLAGGAASDATKDHMDNSEGGEGGEVLAPGQVTTGGGKYKSLSTGRADRRAAAWQDRLGMSNLNPFQGSAQRSRVVPSVADDRVMLPGRGTPSPTPLLIRSVAGGGANTDDSKVAIVGADVETDAHDKRGSKAWPCCCGG